MSQQIAIWTRRRAPSIIQEVRQVGTLVGNASFDSAGGRLLVANIESLNHVRFEPNLKGRFTRTRLAAVSFNKAGPKVTNWDLNPHIDYGGLGSDGERALSLALPADVKTAEARRAGSSTWVSSDSSRTGAGSRVSPGSRFSTRPGTGAR
jgi:hypothetical protein